MEQLRDLPPQAAKALPMMRAASLLMDGVAQRACPRSEAGVIEADNFWAAAAQILNQRDPNFCAPLDKFSSRASH
jgi:uracil phosphoribosyltransferase